MLFEARLRLNVRCAPPRLARQCVAGFTSGGVPVEPGTRRFLFPAQQRILNFSARFSPEARAACRSHPSGNGECAFFNPV
jgi:hypothetical protein